MELPVKNVSGNPKIRLLSISDKAMCRPRFKGFGIDNSPSEVQDYGSLQPVRVAHYFLFESSTWGSAGACKALLHTHS